MNEGSIRVENLVKTYGNGAKRVEVLKGMDVTFCQGEKVAIVGASGVGKTTLLHILGTLDRPTSGKVFYGGNDIFALGEPALAPFRNRQIGFVFQFHHLLPEFNALENTMMPCLIQGLPRKEATLRAEGILNTVGLQERLLHKPGELSGGEQQRVAVARALVLDPKVLLADEPTGNLDPDITMDIMEIFAAINARGTTVIVATHNKVLKERFNHRTIALDRGRIAGK